MNTSVILATWQAQLLDDTTTLTLDELSRACDAQTDWILQLIDEGLLIPLESTTREWRFTGTHLRHARMAQRLQFDLGINLAGAALALQLLDEIARLRSLTA